MLYQCLAQLAAVRMAGRRTVHQVSREVAAAKCIVCGDAPHSTVSLRRGQSAPSPATSMAPSAFAVARVGGGGEG